MMVTSRAYIGGSFQIHGDLPFEPHEFGDLATVIAGAIIEAVAQGRLAVGDYENTSPVMITDVTIDIEESAP